MKKFPFCHVLTVVALLTLAGCDKVDLTAPTGSSITLTAPTRAVPTGGSVDVSAFLLESAGTPVQNGTTVTFTTTLGRVDPVRVLTQGSLARTTFFAGDASGVAEIRATSGAAGGTTATSDSNVITISIGVAAVDTLTVRAVPSSVSATGGTVEIVATALGPLGRSLPGLTVTFTTDTGTLSARAVVTEASGEARTFLSTDRAATVTAAAGSKTATVAVTVRVGPTVTFTCAIGAVTNCASAQVGQPVTFSVARAAATSTIRSASLDFGDGASLDLGTLATPQTITHTYRSSGTFTARVVASDTAGEQTTATLTVVVQAFATLAVSAEMEDTTTRRVRATATIGGVAASDVQSYLFAFGADATPTTITTSATSAQATYAAPGGLKTITVTATLRDGRTVSNSTQINVPVVPAGS